MSGSYADCAERQAGSRSLATAGHYTIFKPIAEFMASRPIAEFVALFVFGMLGGISVAFIAFMI
jgi:hypothetical protein